MKQNDIPAFPKAGLNAWNEAVSVNTGMTLRDYFAAKALQGMLTCQSEETGFYEVKDAASEAYKFADAMLEERAK